MIGQNLMLGNTGARKDRDFYPTPKDVTIALMNFLELPKCTIWEPACGDMAMADVLKSYGHDVIATDISTGDDFFSTNNVCDAIITNPPFNLSEDFILKSLKEADLVTMVLKSQYWHAKKRLSIYKNNPPAYVMPLTWRPDFGNGGAPVMEVLWTVWVKGLTGSKYIPLEKPSINNRCQSDLFSE
jgi:hypothetical protein